MHKIINSHTNDARVKNWKNNDILLPFVTVTLTRLIAVIQEESYTLLYILTIDIIFLIIWSFLMVTWKGFGPGAWQFVPSLNDN